MSPALEKLAKILGTESALLERLDRVMSEQTGRSGVLERIAAQNKNNATAALTSLNLIGKSAAEVRKGLRETILRHESQLLEILKTVPGETEFEKAAALAMRIAKTEKGFFLKKEYAKDILEKRRPENLLKFLGAKDIEEVFKKSGVMEAFSALRFAESDEWMHQTFEDAYSHFSTNDFEERETEVKVLGPEWHEIATRFVAKKHHNVSHLKEFGVIFINPIKEGIPGKFLRDFALLLHYFHEIEFYSKLFRRYSAEEDFPAKFKALLRGDVKEVKEVKAGEWLIVQRYLFKENPSDPRLLLPRVNPESMHWARGERDLVKFGEGEANLDLEMWMNLDWVGGFMDGDRELVSFDLEDNAMTAVSFADGKNEIFSYHQKEALWTKIFAEYAGGEDAMEGLFLKNFDQGVVRFL